MANQPIDNMDEAHREAMKDFVRMAFTGIIGGLHGVLGSKLLREVVVELANDDEAWRNLDATAYAVAGAVDGALDNLKGKSS